jgi:hypothetical protein
MTVIILNMTVIILTTCAVLILTVFFAAPMGQLEGPGGGNGHRGETAG